MSVTLPPEMLDLIVDHLCDDLKTLKACCIVSKSWIPRARRHLFVCVSFFAHVSSIESWMKTFPDPPNSPAHHVRSLTFHDTSSITAANASAWIRAFCHIDTLLLQPWDHARIPFTHLHGLSPTLKSLHVAFSFIRLPEFFDLVSSFPSLEDLSLASTGATDPDGGWVVIPPVSPKFTGRLWLEAFDRTQPVVQRLLGFPGGLHFSGIDVLFHDEETESVAELLSRCSHTLESLSIRHDRSDNIGKQPAFDLSQAAKLKELEISWNRQNVQWIATILQTITSKNLRYITLHSQSSRPFDIDRMDQTVRQGWQNLDLLLAQMWTSLSIHPRITYMELDGGLEDVAAILLPELTGKGFFEVARD